MNAVRIHETGGPEVLRYEEVPVPTPGEGQALVRLLAAGVNFIDVYHRSGLYPMRLPAIIGQEGAGIVDAVGPGGTEVRPGERVAYSNVSGSYAQYVVAPAWRLVAIPDGLDFQQAAAAMLQGMTAHYLTHTTYPLKKGDTALVHAAAGGVGQLLVQMATRRGARVIGTASTEEKARLARSAGADEVILYTQTDFEGEVKRLTAGRGVDVVYDSVGKDTFEKSLNCLSLRGTLVLCGQASGPAPPLDPYTLAKASLFLTRPALHHHTHSRQELMQRAGDVLSWVQSGALKLRIDQVFPLVDAMRAHQRLQSRQAMGKLLLMP